MVKDRVGRGQKTGPVRVDVPRHALRVPQARAVAELDATVDIAAERCTMPIITLHPLPG
jgi:hypothetical protein